MTEPEAKREIKRAIQRRKERALRTILAHPESAGALHVRAIFDNAAKKEEAHEQLRVWIDSLGAP